MPFRQTLAGLGSPEIPRSVCFIWTLLMALVLVQSGCTGRAADAKKSAAVVPPGDQRPGNGHSRGDQSRGDQSPESIHLFDITQQTGIGFVHTSGSDGKFLLPETMTGGVALLDYDCDGLVDIYFCSGRKLLDVSINRVDGSSDAADHLHQSGGNLGGALFKNLGDLRFLDVTKSAGLTGAHFGLGVTAGDYNNDGYADLFLTNYGGDTLYQNRGDGTFGDVSIEVGDSLGKRFSAGASFVDVDNDGLLDLFVARYVQLLPEQLPAQAQMQRSMYPGPQDFLPDACKLLINLGGPLASERTDDVPEHPDGQIAWRDASQTSKIGLASVTGMGVVTGDFDGDGDMDIYVANDEMPNSLFVNDGRGLFEESALALGAAVDAVGAASGSMGVDAGDLDNDGLNELFVTTFENELVTLYRMNDQKLFQDVSRQTRIAEGTLPHVTWGCSIGDLDNDGDRDLYVASGHLDRRNDNNYFRVADLVIKNWLRESGQFRFGNITSGCGDVASVQRTGRGTAIGDLDNDGDLDVVVNNLDDPPSIMENRSVASHHWLQLQLVGRHVNRDAQGAKVRVQVNGMVLVDEVRSGRGYQSSWGSPLHFGLGAATTCEQIEITWPDGRQQSLKDVVCDNRIQVIQSD